MNTLLKWLEWEELSGGVSEEVAQLMRMLTLSQLTVVYAARFDYDTKGSWVKPAKLCD